MPETNTSDCWYPTVARLMDVVNTFVGAPATGVMMGSVTADAAPAGINAPNASASSTTPTEIRLIIVFPRGNRRVLPRQPAPRRGPGATAGPQVPRRGLTFL